LVEALYAWPDQLPTAQPGLFCLEQGAALIRLQQLEVVEPQILAALAASIPEHAERPLVELLAFLRLQQSQSQAAASLLAAYPISGPSTPWQRALQTLLWLELGDLGPIREIVASPTWWIGEEQCTGLAVSRLACLLQSGEWAKAEQALDSYPRPLCLEMVRFKSRLLAQRGNYQQASDLLVQAADRFPQHLGVHAEAASMLIEARSREGTIPFLRRALQRHGEHPRLLESVVRIKLLQREPALARRSQLQLTAAASVSAIPINPAALAVTYEQTGCAAWSPFLHASVHQQPVQISAIQHNLCLNLASLAIPQAATHVRQQVQRLMAAPEYASFATAGPSPCRADVSRVGTPLRVAWLTGDLAQHPVSRFLLGFLAGGCNTFSHEHHLVDLRDHLSESIAEQFDSIPGLQRLDVGAFSPRRKLAAIRELQPQIAIDLSGWTDGNFVTGFMARMAPVQINYLGYFASTGIPAMDYWLGDHQLFPDPMQERHCEEVVRLSRCFIAWQPPDSLPEANVAVMEAPRAGGIRFGSFNHNRKLSDATLRLWGRILQALPSASLVLKANHAGDQATQVLLRRRMLRQVLDPERVIWLPITATPEEHLAQYAQMDVALDCFPNGGCTTTCEALWMGVPVITLTGHAYVSRMATAVLHGAGASELCATSEQHYLELALSQADRLQWLRQHRDHWRQQILRNPLGDAADLMRHLETCFAQLYRTTASRSVANS